jgi:hypothetical protein
MTVEGRHCPPTDVLVAAASPNADRATRERVADHVVGCARCAEELRVLQALQPWAEQNAPLVAGDEEAVQRRAPARSRWAGAAWAYAAAAVLAVAAAALTAQVVRLERANRTLAAGAQAVDAARPAERPAVDLQARVADQQQTIADLERRLAAAGAPDLNVPVIDLEPADRTRTATPAPDTPLTIPNDARSVLFILNTAHSNAGATYEVDLVARDNRVLWSGSGLKQSADRTLTLVVPRALLEPGARVRLFSSVGAKRTLVEEYPVPLAKQ